MCTYTFMLILYSVHYILHNGAMHIICIYSMYTIVTYSHGLKWSLHLIIILVAYSNIKYYPFPCQQIWLHNIFYEFNSTTLTYIFFTLCKYIQLDVKLRKYWVSIILLKQYCLVLVLQFSGFKMNPIEGFIKVDYFYSLRNHRTQYISFIGNIV